MYQGLALDLSATLSAVEQAGLFVSVCTIQTRNNTVTAGSGGQIDLTDWSDVSGLVNIPAMLAVSVNLRPDQGATLRKSQEFDQMAKKHCLLDGYFPAILQQYSAVVDGTRYEIMAVEPDSQKVMTRMALRLWSQ